MKLSTSEAFADMIFSQSKSPFVKTPIDRRYYENKRPCSQHNNRSTISKKLERSEFKLTKDSTNASEKLLSQVIEENKKLKEELESMRKINKQLLDSETLTDDVYKGFYQTVLVEHLQKKVESLGTEANFYRTENEKNMQELDYLKKDTKYIKAIAQKYKNLSIEKKIRTPLVNQSLISESSKDKNLSMKFERKINILTEFVEKMQEKKAFIDLLSSLAEFLQKSMRVEKVSMILVSDDMKELYSKQVKNSFKHNWNETTVIIAEAPFLSTIEISNLSIDQIKAGFTSGKDLYSTISLNDQPAIYICLKKKLVSRGEFNLFTATDFNYFNLITNCASLLIKYSKSREREAAEIEHVLEITDLVSNLINNKNHKELVNNVFNCIPRFLEFESAGIVFRDTSREEFFIMLPSEGGKEKFSDTVSVFSLQAGITGDVYKKKDIRKIENLKGHRLFNSEIDNCSRCGVLNNGIFASLLGIDGKVMGVLQVVNKLNGKNIVDKDVEKVKFLQRIIGMCISCTTCITEVSSLTINFRESVQGAMFTVDAIDRSQNNTDLFEIKNYLNGLKNNMTEWANQQRQKVLNLN